MTAAAACSVSFWGVDRGRLVQLGQQYDCLLQFLPKAGEYVPMGAAMVTVDGGDGPPDDIVCSCVHLGRSRTMYQDPLYGSPARRCCQPGPVTGGQPAYDSRYRYRPSRGAVAADRPTPTAHRFVRGQRRCRAPHASGADVGRDCRSGVHRDRYLWGSSPSVTRRLAAAYDRLHQSISIDLRADVARHIALLMPLASAAILPEHPMATPRPDPRGLG